MLKNVVEIMLASEFRPNTSLQYAKHRNTRIEEPLIDSSVSFPGSLSQFYKYAVFVVFAVVVGQSFVKSTTILIPFSRLSTYDGFENALILILMYFVIITGWIGYFKSINKKPHTETKIGAARFGTDLFILFLFYYMLSLVSEKRDHGDLFVWAFPLIFGTFLFWDSLKYFEYRGKTGQNHEDRRNRIVITAVFFVVVIVQSLIYVYLVRIPLTYNGNTVWNIIFIISSFVITFVYRWKKWKHERRKRRSKRGPAT